ncbi:MAG: hypothetical protein ACK5NT_06795 [Pyrinomonadaceae bacterium]
MKTDNVAPQIHLLPGDSFAPEFSATRIGTEFFVCRECFIYGEIAKLDGEVFWNVRERQLSKTQTEAKFYQTKVRDEFYNLKRAATGANVNLWFEYEAFCQVNLWFAVAYLYKNAREIAIVYPPQELLKTKWDGFAAISGREVLKCLDSKIVLSDVDCALAEKLWSAFRTKDFAALAELSELNTNAFPTLKEVSEALIEIDVLPQKIVAEIISSGTTEFHEVFKQFSARAPVYGFGDTQVRVIFDRMVRNNQS